MRRGRSSQLIRDMLSEFSINTKKLVMPIFLDESLNGKREIPSMPGIFRYDLKSFSIHLEDLVSSGITNILLFGIPGKKDSIGSSSYAEDGIVQRAISLAKEKFKVNVFVDLCLCEYTDTGQCGIIKDGYVDNDSTLSVYNRIAVSYAKAGADFVAPSGMMDGQVGSIRKALDAAGYQNVMIMAYSNKYASSLYSPFRDAADSAPKIGDRKSYQMDYRRAEEFILETSMDVEEGADVIMVKPGLFYLDIVKSVKQKFSLPLAVYSVSGEYSMLKTALEKGILPAEVLDEYIYSIFRAGADIVISYFALELGKRYQETKN